MREAAKVKKILAEALRRPLSASGSSSGTAPAATSPDAVPATQAVAAESVKDGRRGHGEGNGTGRERDSLVELAERLLRRSDDVDRELEGVREALSTAR